MRRTFQYTVIATLLAAIHVPAIAQTQTYRLQDAASKAVSTNPEVMNKWHQFQASLKERDVSWGRYLPTLDVLYGVGYKREESPTLPTANKKANYHFQTEKATLRQNLFEGFGTVHDVKRLEHASMVRFYEMLDFSETAALEAAKAYVDVWRFRQLVAFAEESYAVHRTLYEKIKERAESGVGRKVDLETAAGRLALSESNLLTETSNLHDVTARYQRIVGELPPSEMADPPSALLRKELPKERKEAVMRGIENSPQLKAAYENILSAMRQVQVQQANYFPRVDAYIEKTRDTSVAGQGYNGGATHETTYAVTATWNLFNGLRDQAKEKKATEEKYSAKDLREKVCRDVRQNTAMSYNEHLSLTERLQYLDQHQLSTDKAREAFRRQFDIGQRTLLDVLDTENEYYTARRNFLNGEMDLVIADAKYHAASGGLVKLLQLTTLEMDPPRPETTPEEDMATTCAADPVALVGTDKEAVFQKAKAKEDLLRGPAPVAPTAAPAPAAKAKKPTAVKKQ